jgi:radical SAM protein with 4Fe4S-binding SPASM domain
VTEKAGVANDRWGYGCAVGDYDNDGWPDLYVTNYGKNRLYHNNHDGTFTDVADKAGVAIATWSTGATFGDYDGDGRLDLFVAGYAQIDLAHPPLSGTKEVGYKDCQFRGVPVMCGPRGLKGEQDHLFHNNGDGTFTDVSKKLGVDNPNGYYGLGVLFADVNNDGKPDLLVANDSTPNYLFINKGDGTFENDSYISGYALNGDGREIANMGIAVGDYENNGHLSVVNTDFADDYNVLFQNDGTGFFTDVSYRAGIAASSIPFVGFADGFLDYDNDGWKDLLIINGHVYPEVDQHPEWGQSYAQRPLLYHNLKNGKFELVPAVEGTGLAVVSVGRGQLDDLLSGEDFERVFGKIYKLSHRVNFQIKTTEAMHYRRYLLQHNLEERKIGHGHPGSARPAAEYEPGAPTADAHTRTASWATRRVNDGKGFLFVSHVGNVYPSGFLPIHAGNIRETPLSEIYRNAPIFKSLRDTSKLEGKCGACEYKEICGGSRARAYAVTGDPLAQEPCCIYQPKHWDPELENAAAAFAKS